MMHSKALNLDSLIAGLSEEFDSSLRDIRDLDRIYENGLREACLELLAREKRLAAAGGGPMEALGDELAALVGVGISKATKEDGTTFAGAHAPIDRERQGAVNTVVAQERGVGVSGVDELKWNLENYLAKRFDPLNYAVHVPFVFVSQTGASQTVSGGETRGTLTVREVSGKEARGKLTVRHLRSSPEAPAAEEYK